MQLKDRTILVTGGSRGIGRTMLPRLLAHRPRALIVVARGGSALEEVATLDPAIRTIACDLADPAAVDALAATVRADHPDLSVLINNAGTQALTDLVASDAPERVASLRREIALNFEGVIALTLGVMPVLLAQPAAALVSITSGLALAPKQSSPVYCATKAGMRSFTKALRYQAEARAAQLRVIEALPPLVDTGMTEGRGRGKISADACAREIVDGIVAGKTGIYVGKAKLLRAIFGLSPTLAERIMRHG